MVNKLVLGDPSEVVRLATALDSLLSMRKFRQDGEPAGWNIAHGLADIEQSCKAIVDERLPALLAAAGNPVECQEVLLQIGEDLRHILYHTRDIRFFRYIGEE
jgi:hypothetical protein